MSQQAFRVTERAHPFGEAGVRMSLDEVADRIGRGMTNPYVRTYAIEKLAEAKRRGEPIESALDRARILLRVMQQEKIWVPDPANAEYMPEAHLLACDPKNPHKTPDGQTLMCVGGDDCDGKTIALGAMLGSVGIPVMVVGHGYEGDRVEHVLLAAWIKDKWHYADPSVDISFGQVVPFSWERLLSTPSVRVLCNASSCLTGKETSYNPDQNNFVTQGRFVGVAGVPSLRGLSSKVVWESSARAVEWVTRASVQWLGATQEIIVKDDETELSTVEKLMIAGTIISAAGLAFNIWNYTQNRRVSP